VVPLRCIIARNPSFPSYCFQGGFLDRHILSLPQHDLRRARYRPCIHSLHTGCDCWWEKCGGAIRARQDRGRSSAAAFAHVL